MKGLERIIIVAMTKDKVIGLNGSIPWHISEEIKLFKQLTINNTVIMGRITYESIGKPLPDRNNIVISSTLKSIEGVDVCTDLQKGIGQAEKYNKKIFIIGGAQIYKAALPLIDKLYISWIKKDYKGDIYFPDFDISSWNIEKKETHDEFDFIIYIQKEGKKVPQDSFRLKTNLIPASTFFNNDLLIELIYFIK